jgi:hypothetical protein
VAAVRPRPDHVARIVVRIAADLLFVDAGRCDGWGNCQKEHLPPPHPTPPRRL